MPSATLEFRTDSRISIKKSKTEGRAVFETVRRSSRAKQEVSIFDYINREVAVLWRMFQKRLGGHRGQGYAKGDAPRGLGDAGDEPAAKSRTVADLMRNLEAAYRKHSFIRRPLNI